jgi:tetratricopeptide (TPR) repeat protein
MIKHIVISVFIISVLVSCRQAEENSAEKKPGHEKTMQHAAPSRDSLVQHVTNMEKELHKFDELETAKANSMIIAYVNFANHFKKDSLTPEYLFRAAELAMNVERSNDAIAYLTRISENYPDYKNMPFVIYYQGFIYDSMTGNDSLAKEYYTQFLETYPDHHRADEVRAMIRNLHKSDLELVHEFENRKDN